MITTEVDTTGDGTYNVTDHYVLDVMPESPSAGVPGVATAQPVLVFNGSETLIGRNLVAPNAAGVDAVDIEGTVSSLTQADTDQYNLTDDLGSLRIVVDNASAILDEIAYSSAGQVAYESSPATAHFAGFAGGHVDPYTALDLFYHRFYDPATEKWLSQDPADFAGGDTNLSRYAGNDVTNLADAIGLAPNMPGGSYAMPTPPKQVITPTPSLSPGEKPIGPSTVFPPQEPTPEPPLTPPNVVPEPVPLVPNSVIAPGWPFNTPMPPLKPWWDVNELAKLVATMQKRHHFWCAYYQNLGTFDASIENGPMGGAEAKMKVPVFKLLGGQFFLQMFNTEFEQGKMNMRVESGSELFVSARISPRN